MRGQELALVRSQAQVDASGADIGGRLGRTDGRARDARLYNEAGRKLAWDQHRETIPAFEALRRVGRYSNIEVDFHDGRFKPQARHWTSGPDPFELEIGNLLVYAVPLRDEGGHWERLREQVVDILGLPEPYPQLTRLFEIGLLESHELAGKAKDLGELLDQYATS